MEEAKKIDLSERPLDQKNGFPGCTTWIFGNEESADNDLGKCLEVEE